MDHDLSSHGRFCCAIKLYVDCSKGSGREPARIHAVSMAITHTGSQQVIVNKCAAET